MEYIKCGSCCCFKSIEEIGCRKSGIVYKCCKRCRTKNKADDKDDKKVPELNEDGSFKIKGVEYEVKRKYLDKDMAMKLMPNFGKRYENIEDMPDENEVIPKECYKYELGTKMTPEMMDKMGIRITSADDEDNNIYPN